MASSLSIKPCGGNSPMLHPNTPHRISYPSVVRSNSRNKRGPKRIVALMSTASNTTLSHSRHGGSDFINHSQDPIFSPRLDQWMEESAEAIVKNLKQAPLLVHIYEDDGNEGKPKMKTERAIMENWPIVRSEWENGERKSPDGLMFVEEIDGGCGDYGDSEGMTGAWGIVVQGKGVECGPACYLLKTSRVGAGLGLGMFCTHFSLVRVKSFSQSALSQFKDSWLLR